MIKIICMCRLLISRLRRAHWRPHTGGREVALVEPYPRQAQGTSVSQSALRWCLSALEHPRDWTGRRRKGTTLIFVHLAHVCTCNPSEAPERRLIEGAWVLFVRFRFGIILSSADASEVGVWDNGNDQIWHRAQDLVDFHGKIVDLVAVNSVLLRSYAPSPSMPTSRRHCRARRAGTFAWPAIVCAAPTGANVA